MKPQNLEEKIVWYYITGTYVLFLLGAQHFVAPLMGWFFGGYVCKKLWEQTDETPPEERITIPFGVWLWVICMLMMEVTIIANHLDFDLGLTRIIKSTINIFGKSWALMALFPLAGCLKIRPQLISRAVCILCLQSLFFIPVSYIAGQIGLPDALYVSPLYKVGAVGKAAYTVFLYGTEPGSSATRLFLFAPWAPALGLIGNIYFFLAWQDPNKKWRWIGMISSAIMVWGSASRLGLISLVCIPIITFGLINATKPVMQITAGVGSLFAGLFGSQLITTLKDFKDNLEGQRASSSRVREILNRMAFYRWQTEAPIWGHGFLDEKGPYLVAYKPIGSHHTWFGVLFTQGIVGFIALATAMTLSFVDLLIKAQKNATAQVGLTMLLVLIFYSIGENIEALAYLYWPGLMMMGIAFKEKISLTSSEACQETRVYS
ncbi:MAG: O-antigen ligase family protein [Kastovskya adunca ATA6-11-RM4]|jgi:hypothetical protein|nr:O-antigen ligase family protein [Kastovskya adunca ATA6-11-RM4]